MKDHASVEGPNHMVLTQGDVLSNKFEKPLPARERLLREIGEKERELNAPADPFHWGAVCRESLTCSSPFLAE